MLTSRVLPPEEWSKLAETSLKDVWDRLKRESCRVVVVEEDGQIVGSVAVMTMVHLEGLEITPSHRRRGTVWRRLLREVGGIAQEAGIAAMVAGSASDEMDDYLRRMNGTELPAKFFVVPMSAFRKESASCPQL